MTYSPTMKFHNYFPKNILYSIFFICILSSCASLNTSNQTYNLEGKFSYVSEDFSAILSTEIKVKSDNLIITLYEPINGSSIASLQGQGNDWKILNETKIDFSSILPKPREILYSIKGDCLNKNGCQFEFIGIGSEKIKVILRNV